MLQETDFQRFEVIPCVPATALTPRLKPISKDEGISGIKMAIKTRYSVVHIGCATTRTVGPTDNDFSDNELLAETTRFVCIKTLTACKKFFYNEHPVTANSFFCIFGLVLSGT